VNSPRILVPPFRNCASPDALEKEPYRRLSPSFAGPEILDAMDRAERLMAQYGISVDDEQGMERVVREAVEITLAGFVDEECD
jgi:hypothetical protein